MRLNNLLEFVSNSNVIVKVIDEKSKIVKYEGVARGTLNKPEFNHFEVVSIDSCIECIEENSVAVIEIYTKNIYDELSNKLLEEQRKFVEKVKNATEEELKQNPRWNELRRLLDAEEEIRSRIRERNKEIYDKYADHTKEQARTILKDIPNEDYTDKLTKRSIERAIITECVRINHE